MSIIWVCIAFLGGIMLGIIIMNEENSEWYLVVGASGFLLASLLGIGYELLSITARNRNLTDLLNVRI